MANLPDPGPAEVAKWAEAILAAVHEDMARPFPWGEQIPPDVGDFGSLHDYCDANMYALDIMGEQTVLGDGTDDSNSRAADLTNAVVEAVHQRLIREAAEIHAVMSGHPGDVSALTSVIVKVTGMGSDAAGPIAERMVATVGDVWTAGEPVRSSLGGWSGLTRCVTRTDEPAQVCPHSHPTKDAAWHCAAYGAGTVTRACARPDGR